MAPKKKQSEDKQEENKTEQQLELVFDSVAVGHIKLQNGEHHVVTVEIDSKNLVAGEVKLVSKCEDLREAQYEFKITAAKNGLV